MKRKSTCDYTVAELRNKGYAVIVWTPEELGSADSRLVEDRSTEVGYEIIIEAASSKE